MKFQTNVDKEDATSFSRENKIGETQRSRNKMTSDFNSQCWMLHDKVQYFPNTDGKLFSI